MPPPLPTDEVHVWRARLDLSDDGLQVCAATLTAAERERAARYRFEAPRRHFTVARGTLRRLLARYVDVSPGTLEFDYGDYGKPVLASPRGGVRFNVSHSGDVVLLAFGRGRDVGVDVERSERQVAWDTVARRFFSRQELDDLEALPGEARREAFFRCWTRKEAFIKATGHGVAFGLSNFAVSLRPDQGPAVVWVREGEAAAWRLTDADPGAGYAGALCARGRDWQVRYLTV